MNIRAKKSNKIKNKFNTQYFICKSFSEEGCSGKACLSYINDDMYEKRQPDVCLYNMEQNKIIWQPISKESFLNIINDRKI